MLNLILILSTVSGITPECQKEWTNIISSQSNSSLPSYYSEMFIYSGFNFNNLGNFDSCNQIDEAKFVVEVFNSFPPVVIALCGPKVCTAPDYSESPIPLSPFSMVSNYQVIFPKEYQEARYSSYNTGAICMFLFIALVTALGIGASVAEHFLSEERKSTSALKALLCFSIVSNGQKLLLTRTQERLGKPDSLELLNGVRVMSIGWVILGHTCLNYMYYAVTSNYNTAFDQAKESNYIVVAGGFYAVDTFFWLSGLLMAYLFILEVNKTPNFSAWKLSMVYIHRYLRITPVYMFCLLFFWAMQVYIGSGPMWFDIGTYIGECKEYWYTNLIYLNNFIPDWKASTCLSVSWYLADDMQLFAISPIIILLYIKFHRSVGWMIIFVLCCLNIVVAGIIAHRFNLNPAIFARSNGNNYFVYYYIKPYNRVAPYVLGIACGFIVYTYRKYQDTNEVYDRFALFIAKMQEVWHIRIVSFLLGLGLINLLIFSQYSNYKYPGENFQYGSWSRNEDYAFIAFERVVFGIGLSLLFLPMLLGHFKPITAFLSLYPWSILARFTFVIYLIHYSIIQIIIKSQKNVLMVTPYYNIRDTIYFFIVSLFFAIPIVMLIEMPFGNLEKLVFSKPSSKSGKEALLGESGDLNWLKLRGKSDIAINQELSPVKG